MLLAEPRKQDFAEGRIVPDERNGSQKVYNKAEIVDDGSSWSAYRGTVLLRRQNGITCDKRIVKFGGNECR